MVAHHLFRRRRGVGVAMSFDGVRNDADEAIGLPGRAA